jgi:hypothetical protein
MTEDAQAVIEGALDKALAEQVCKLVSVLMADTSEEGFERFMRGLNKAVGVHERLIEIVSADPCIAAVSSGS